MKGMYAWDMKLKLLPFYFINRFLEPPHVIHGHTEAYPSAYLKGPFVGKPQKTTHPNPKDTAKHLLGKRARLVSFANCAFFLHLGDFVFISRGAFFTLFAIPVPLQTYRWDQISVCSCFAVKPQLCFASIPRKLSSVLLRPFFRIRKEYNHDLEPFAKQVLSGRRKKVEKDRADWLTKAAKKIPADKWKRCV